MVSLFRPGGTAALCATGTTGTVPVLLDPIAKLALRVAGPVHGCVIQSRSQTVVCYVVAMPAIITMMVCGGAATDVPVDVTTQSA